MFTGPGLQLTGLIVSIFVLLGKSCSQTIQSPLSLDQACWHLMNGFVCKDFECGILIVILTSIKMGLARKM